MIVIGNDHAATTLKNKIIEYFRSNNIEYMDCGCSDGEKCDYPLKAKEVCDFVLSKKADVGILLCGTGVGMSIAANKIKGIRAAVCSDYYSAKYTRLHNDANVLCLGARVVGDEYALELINVFINTDFEGGRHTNRVNMITDIEK